MSTDALIPSAVRLPFTFDVERMAADLRQAQQHSWSLHYNQQDYDGDWTSLSLRSTDGSMASALAAVEGQFQDTPLKAQCPYLSWVMDQFRCDKLAVRLLNLAPGSIIKPHRDVGLTYHEGEFRVHVPILTHDLVDFEVDGQRIEMKAGECWYADFTQLHSVANRGTSPRVHLVLDCVRNDWTDDLFRSLGYDPSQMPPPPQRSMSELKAMYDIYIHSGHPELEKQATEIMKEILGRLPRVS